MIISGAVALDNLGWVDRGSIWSFDIVNRTQQLESVPQARYLSLSRGEGDLFRVVHGSTNFLSPDTPTVSR
jgi:hypothetical protein